MKAATGGGALYEKVLLKFCKFHEKTPVLESLFNKVAGEEHLQVAASDLSRGKYVQEWGVICFMKLW